jgi:trk system potassium uptake protein TrkA
LSGNGRGRPATVAVIGLGRFGGQVARSLAELGLEVIGIEAEMAIVDQLADRLHHVVQADATDEDALRQLGVATVDRAVVGIGENIEASILTVVALADLGVREIWAKAISRRHGRILRAVGARYVIYPEAEMGDRVAHLISAKLIDFIDFGDGFAVAETRVPADAVDRSLTESALRTRHGVTVIGVGRTGEGFARAVADTVLRRGDVLVVAGRTENVQRFAAAT